MLAEGAPLSIAENLAGSAASIQFNAIQYAVYAIPQLFGDMTRLEPANSGFADWDLAEDIFELSAVTGASNSFKALLRYGLSLDNIERPDLLQGIVEEMYKNRGVSMLPDWVDDDSLEYLPEADKKSRITQHVIHQIGETKRIISEHPAFKGKSLPEIIDLLDEKALSLAQSNAHLWSRDALPKVRQGLYTFEPHEFTEIADFLESHGGPQNVIDGLRKVAEIPIDPYSSTEKPSVKQLERCNSFLNGFVIKRYGDASFEISGTGLSNLRKDLEDYFPGFIQCCRPRGDNMLIQSRNRHMTAELIRHTAENGQSQLLSR